MFVPGKERAKAVKNQLGSYPESVQATRDSPTPALLGVLLKALECGFEEE